MKTLFSVLLLLVFVFGFVYGSESEEGFRAADRARAQLIFESLKDTYPQVRAYHINGRVTKLYGSSFGSGFDPEQAARGFVDQYAEVFGVDRKDLISGSIRPDGAVIQPLMYDEATGKYKFALAYYRQERNGIPVFRADLRVLVRNENGYPVVLATSGLKSLGDFAPSDKATVDFSLAEFAARVEVPSLDKFRDEEAVIWAGYDDTDEAPRMAAALVGYNDRGERWRFVVDAQTSEVLYKRDLIIFENVSGNVQGNVTQGNGSEQCEAEMPESFKYARVNIGSAEAYTDDNGDYVITNGGTSDVTVQSRAWGQYFRVYNFVGTDVVLSQTVTPPGPANFIQNEANTSEFVRSQINAYVEANEIRDMVLVQNPSYPGLSGQMPIYVNRNDFYCPANAWYDQIEISLNFCSASGSYPNTAWSSVLHHEFGHHLVEMAGSGQDQYGEGIGDAMSVLMSDSPELGLGFFGSCTTPLRTADNTMQYPCTGEAHDCAGLLSGCIWDTRNALLAQVGSGYLDILKSLTVNSILLHTGSLATPQIAIDFLTLDDDDANLDNGTPHWDAICTGFGLHNMDCPELIPLAFSYPSGLPDEIEPYEETTFQVQVSGAGDTPISGTGMLHYSVNGGAFTSVAMTELSSNLYEATLPEMDCGSTLEWYVTAEAVSFGEVSDPSGAPTDAYEPIIASEVIDLFSDNFQTNKLWTTSSTATAGNWQRGIPAGGGERGDPASDFDGSGMCYLTGNTAGDSDIDGGYVYLVSPTFDISSGDGVIHYARWYSNNFGADPNNDLFKVYVSNNNGTSWILVETVGPAVEANGGWYERTFTVSDFVTPTNQVKIRFEASDLGSGSVVEAAVDDVTVEVFNCTSNIPVIMTETIPDWTSGIPLSLQLVAEHGIGALTWSDKYGNLTGTGLTLGTDGMLTGNPTVGQISFTGMVTDEEMQSDEQEYTFTVNESVVITTAAINDWTAGFALSTQLTATGGTAPLVWSDLNDDLEGTGLTLGTGGLLSGIPAAAGSIVFTAHAADQAGSTDDQEYTFTINAPVTITTTDVPPAVLAHPYSYQLEAENGTGQLTWDDKDNSLFLSGLTLSASGLLSGTIYMNGPVDFIAIVEDEVGAADEQAFIVQISQGVQITQTAMPAWTVGHPYSVQLQATGGVGTVIWNDKNDDLDGTGLALSASGLVSGTPTATGTITFTAEAEDEVPSQDEQVFNIQINGGVSFETIALPDWTVGRSYSVQLHASGGTGTIQWSNVGGDLSGTGLALSATGLLNGIPSSAGTKTFTTGITDQVGDYQERQYDVLINPAVSITTMTLPDGKEGDSYSEQLYSAGGTGTHTWEDKYADLDGSGLTFTEDGLLSGTPAEWGTISFTAAVADVTGSTAESLFEVLVHPPYICGDIDGNDTVDILDITFYVNWKFKGDAAPDPQERADVNNDGLTNVLDIIHLINYKFKSGPVPDCGFGGLIITAKRK